MIWFTSDLHLGHRGIITMQNRPFDSVEEMNRDLVRNFNAFVHKGDSVYILGDICHHMKVEEANEIISGLHGEKYLLIGNHDKKYDPGLFREMRDFMTVSLNGRYFALMHYPMLSWPKKNSGSIHLHGHIHARQDYNLKNREEGILRYDVGVDANQFTPVSLQQILAFFDGCSNLSESSRDEFHDRLEEARLWAEDVGYTEEDIPNIIDEVRRKKQKRIL